MSELDLGFVRQQFPAFSDPENSAWAFFENAGGTFAAGTVIGDLSLYYMNSKVQPYGLSPMQRLAGERMDAGRAAMAELLGVSVDAVTLGPSTTQNFNTLSQSLIGHLKAGDEIIVSAQDHESNIGGWERAAQISGAQLKLWPVDAESGELSLADLDALVTERTRVIAFTHASNIIASVNPVSDVVARARAVDALVVLDGVSYAQHAMPNWQALDVDAYTFSTYKTYATHLGVMVTSERLRQRIQPQCHFFNAKRPWSMLDAAGPDHASIAALTGLKRYFESLYTHHFGSDDSLSLCEKVQRCNQLMLEHEHQLCAPVLACLSKKAVRLLGKPTMQGREATVSFVPLEGSASAVVEGLAEHKIAAKNGHFYAYRLLQQLAIENLEDGVVRLSFAHYNSLGEQKRLIEALDALLPDQN